MGRLAALTVMAALVACGADAPSGPGTVLPSGVDPGAVDPLTAGLLDAHGLRATGATTTQAIEVGDPADVPWLLYLEASRQAGLGDSWDRGAMAELRTTPVDGSVDGIRAHVLVAEGRVIGAWLSHPSAVPGIYALNQPP